MGLFDIFRRAPAIRDSAALADFIDEHAAFLVQKGIYEYARARAGRFSMMLMKEAAFIDAVNRSRWRAFPLGLAMVAEITEGILRRHTGDDRRALLDPLNSLVLSIFDRYPFPAQLAKAEWLDARRELARRLDLIGIHAVKFAKDVPEPFAENYFALMPIHEKVRAHDYQAIRNYMRVTACNIHAEFERCADIAALVEGLRSSAT